MRKDVQELQRIPNGGDFQAVHSSNFSNMCILPADRFQNPPH